MIMRRLKPRQRFLFALTFVLLALAPVRADEEWNRRSITINSTPLQGFETAAPDRVRFGPLDYLGGLILRAEAPRFGGMSGLVIDASGMLLAVTDHGWWLRAKLLTDNDRPTGLANAEMAPILGPDGKPLGRTKRFDSEALAMHNGIAWVGLERVHEVLRFDFGRDGLAARGQLVSVPREAKTLPSNQSFEAVCYAAAGPARGTLIAIAERARKGENQPTRGFILEGANKGAFDVKRIVRSRPMAISFCWSAVSVGFRASPCVCVALIPAPSDPMACSTVPTCSKPELARHSTIWKV